MPVFSWTLLPLAILSTLLPPFSITAAIHAQERAAEFIESSSPLAGGGRVTSRSTANQGLQTVTTVGTMISPRSAETQSNSVFNREPLSQTQSVFRPAAQGSVEVQGANREPRYPYPASNQNLSDMRYAQRSLLYSPIRATAPCPQCELPYQVPTLGITNRVTSARQAYGGNCCSPSVSAPTTSLQVPAVLQIQPANQVPSLAIQDPAGLALASPTLGTSPGFSNPIIGNNNVGSNFFNSPVNGSGAYQPLIRLANMRPGTYLGQGIIGQPTAYVDGQPIRNLLRYIAP